MKGSSVTLGKTFWFTLLEVTGVLSLSWWWIIAAFLLDVVTSASAEAREKNAYFRGWIESRLQRL